MDIEIIETKDGSHTLYSKQFDEIYHSRHGAVSESEHVFIHAGLDALEKKEINVFEVGLGTGLNALLSWIYTESRVISIRYDSVELYPVPIELTSKINYATKLENEDKFRQIHLANWGELIDLSPQFSFKKIHASVLEIIYPLPSVDVIFFDAFSPEKQPEMWAVEVFKKMHDMLLPGGILVTYCSKSSVRRNMMEAGFIITKLPGPHGKREMVRATKPINH
jgi:tRNA U34 5-methylaminomethyl-2-thiouridine-forming methyltransferase MnmC